MFQFLAYANGRHVFKDDVKQWIKYGRNVELRHMIRNAKASQLADSEGLTLLHLSASYGNQELTKFLVEQGFAIDAKTSSGYTPLTMAVACNRFELAELLLQSGAEVYSEDTPSECALQMVVRNSMIVPPRVFKLFYDSLKSSYTTNEIWVVLLAMKCPLDGVVAMQNTALTRSILSARSFVEEAESVASVRVAVELVDVSNLRVLMNDGVDCLQRSYAFFAQLVDLTTSPRKDLQAVRTFVDYLSDYDSWSLYSVDCVRRIFEKADECVLRMFLEYEIHLRIKSQTSIDVVAHCYGNRYPAIRNLIKQLLIKCYPIEFGIDGRSGLHYAAKECVVENVKVHLSVCLIPDVLDKRGRSPLFEVFGSPQNVVGKEECVNQLLLHGADVQIADYSGDSVLDLCHSQEDWYLLQLVLAHLAMQESLGFAVDEIVRYKIFKNKHYSNYYKLCHEQLDQLKKYWVCDTLTAYACVTQSIVMISQFLKNWAMKNMMIHRGYIAKLNRYYSFLFDGFVEEISLMKVRKSKAASVIYECFGKLRPYEGIVDKIVSYFSYIDLCAFD